MKLTSAIVLVLTAVLAAPAATACSVTDDYRVPTNLELMAKAELILLAKVESGPTDMNFQGASMVVSPVEVLKGQLPTGQVKLLGMIAEPRFAVMSNPLQLEQAHPLAYIGGCTRYMFVKGSTVLFFVTPAERAIDRKVPAEMRGMLLPAGGAFSRWAEDVLSADSPWVRATRIYIAAAALPKDQQSGALIAERDKLRAAGDQDSKVIADDIDRQLAGPNKPWNERMDEEIKKMRERGKDPLEEAADELEKAAEEISKHK